MMNEEYKLTIKDEDEIEACKLIRNTETKGYYNCSVFQINYKKGVLTFVYLNSGILGTRLHFINEVKVENLDVKRIKSMEPKEAFEYLTSFLISNDNVK